LFFMIPKIVSWNMKGLNEKEKRLGTRGLLKDWKANMVLLTRDKNGVYF
jgi:hypothetical protein